MSTTQEGPELKDLEAKLKIEYDAIYIRKADELQRAYDRKIEATTAQLIEDNRKEIQKVLEDWKKEQQPPTPEEISTLLNQEYFTFDVKVKSKEGDRTFQIVELPQSVEKKVYRKLKEKLLPKIQDFQGLAEQLSKDPKEDIGRKITKLIEMVEPTIDILADTVAIILDPYESDPTITPFWVQENIASFRQWNILVAQDHANRIRDFFSRASRTSLSGKMKGVGSLS